MDGMNIQITEVARERMRSFLAERPGAAGVRFGVRKTGCSGYAYEVEIAERIEADDQTLDQDGITLVVDRKIIPFVDGTQIDFARQGLNAAFVFRNPNVTGECGCGESFTVGATL